MGVNRGLSVCFNRPQIFIAWLKRMTESNRTTSELLVQIKHESFTLKWDLVIYPTDRAAPLHCSDFQDLKHLWIRLTFITTLLFFGFHLDEITSAALFIPQLSLFWRRPRLMRPNRFEAWMAESGGAPTAQTLLWQKKAVSGSVRGHGVLVSVTSWVLLLLFLRGGVEITLKTNSPQIPNTEGAQSSVWW